MKRIGLSATLLVLAMVSGCGGDGDRQAAPESTRATLLDTARVEREIRRAIRDQRDVTATVSCPREIRQARGVNFVCTARTADGESPFAVVQTDDAGTVTYSAAETVETP